MDFKCTLASTTILKDILHFQLYVACMIENITQAGLKVKGSVYKNCFKMLKM